MAEISKLSGVAIANVAKVDAVTKANIANINDLTIPSAAAFLLDTYTGAEAAYSVRKLKTGVTVAARIRRSGDDIEADVEFDTNDEISLNSPISNASSGTYTDLADFVDHTGTARDAFIDEWKDQSGSGNHASQATQGNQPKLYDATTGLITENGKAAVDFRSLQNLTMTSTDLITAFAVGRADTDNSNSENYLMSGTVLWGYNRTYAADDSIGIQVGSNRVSVGTVTDNNQKLGYVNNQSGTQYVAQDGGTAASGSVSSGAVTMMGNRLPRTYYTLNGTIQEIVIWTTDESSNRSGIETDINGYFSIY